MSLIGGRFVPMTFPVIVDNKYSKQDDGDNLQSQGHDGELQPHAGGVRRHPETNTGYLKQSDTHTHTHPHSACLALPRSFLRVVLCKGS